MSIDIRTLVVVLGITHLIQFAVLAQQYRINRAYRGPGWWLLWSVAEVVAFVSMLLRQAPSVRSAAIIVQNSTLILGTIFIYVGVMRFLDRTVNRTAVVSFFAVFVASLVFFLLVYDDITARSVIIAGALAATAFTTAWALFVHRIPSISAAANFNIVAFALHGGVFAYRAAAILITAPVIDIYSAAFFNSIIYLDGLVVGLLWTFGLIIMVNQRLHTEMKESEEQFRNVYDTAPLAFVLWDRETRVTGWNDQAERMFGWTREEMLGQNFFEYMVPESARVHVHEVVRLLLDGKLPSRSVNENVTKSGRVLVCEWNNSVIRDPGGNIVGVTSLGLDITERRQRERMIQEKNAELERFTYSISHDLKTPLVTVKTFLGFLREDISAADAAKIEKDVRFMQSAVDKMICMLGEILELSRIGRRQNAPVRVAFREVVDEAVQMVAGRIAAKAVEVRIDESPIALVGERQRFVEIWQNLIDNAAKYMGGQKEPLIEIGVETVSREPTFHVRDNGIGIDPRYNDKVFGLFNKLDPRSEGTGVGLTLAKRIVETYDGRIWVDSDGPAKGTTFRFTLPKAVAK